MRVPATFKLPLVSQEDGSLTLDESTRLKSVRQDAMIGSTDPTAGCLSDQTAKPSNDFSFAAHVRSLALGDTASRSLPVDFTSTQASIVGDAEHLQYMRQQARNACKSAVRSAVKAHPDRTFKTEVGDVAMSSGSIFVVAVVTRTA